MLVPSREVGLGTEPGSPNTTHHPWGSETRFAVEERRWHGHRYLRRSLIPEVVVVWSCQGQSKSAPVLEAGRTVRRRLRRPLEGLLWPRISRRPTKTGRSEGRLASERRRRSGGGASRRSLSGGRDAESALAQAVALALEGDHGRVVDEPVDQGGGDHGVAEDLAPLLEAAVGGDDDRAALVAPGDEREEEVGCAALERQVADLVDDEQVVALEPPELGLELVAVLG